MLSLGLVLLFCIFQCKIIKSTDKMNCFLRYFWGVKMQMLLVFVSLLLPFSCSILGSPWSNGKCCSAATELCRRFSGSYYHHYAPGRFFWVTRNVFYIYHCSSKMSCMCVIDCYCHNALEARVLVCWGEGDALCLMNTGSRITPICWNTLIR